MSKSTNSTESTKSTESTPPATTETKAEPKINWGSVAKDTAIIGGATVGGAVAVGVLYGVFAKVAVATYNALS